MTTFDKIREHDSEIYDVFVKYTPVTNEILKTIKHPKTGLTLVQFMVKTNFIKEGIFELYESENLYSMSILFRSMIEHFLRFQYIFLRFAKDKNDSIGEDYIVFCSLNEFIEIGKSWKDVSKISGERPVLDPYDLLKEFNPDFARYSRKEIENKSHQFRYKNIIKFIHELVDNRPPLVDTSLLLKLIPKYADLSSFVHGGPNSDKEMMKNISEEVRNKVLLDIIEQTFIMTASVKSFSYLMLYQEDRRLGSAYNEVQSIMKKHPLT